MKMSDTIRDIVLRARQGDQNAMALVVEVTKEARANPNNMRAQLAYRMFLDFTKKHPVTPDAVMSGDPEPQVLIGDLQRLNSPASFFQSFKRLAVSAAGLLAAAVALANGPNLTNDRILSLTQSVPNGQFEDVGKVIQEARAIQLVRLPNVPTSVLSEAVGWELG